MATVIERCRNMFLLHRSNDSIPARSIEIIDSQDDDLPFDRIQCEDLRKIGDAWLRMERQPSEALPRWSAFDPARFTRMLDKFCVLKAGDLRADEIEFSLCGGHATHFIGQGKMLSLQEMRHDPQRAPNYRDVRNRASRAIENEAPQYVRKTLSWNDKNCTEYEALMLPFMPQGTMQRLLQPVSARIRLI